MFYIRPAPQILRGRYQHDGFPAWKIGFFGLDHQVSTEEIWYTFIGVMGIGFFNFAVSFGLAFIVAVKSRGIHLKEYPQFLGILWRYLRKYPHDFIKAPAARKAEHLS